MLLLDILIAGLLVFPFLAELVAAGLPASAPDVGDLGVPLLAVALIATGMRHGPHWIALAVLAGLFGLAMLSETAAEAMWKLTNGTGAVVFVALVMVLVRQVSSEPWERSFFVRHGQALAHAWLCAIRRAPTRAHWTASFAIAALLFAVALYRHRAFQSHGFDLGIFTNTIWNLVHGNGYVSSVKGGINLFADHQSPLFWLLAPLFWLAPRPETLLLAQAAGLAAGGPALYYLGRALFGPTHWAPAALPWLYWSYLPLRNANAFDFHPEVFMLPLFLWAFAGFLSGKRWAQGLGVLALLGALAAKESAAVVAVGVGIAWTLLGLTNARRNPWPGAALVVIGIALFAFNLKVVPQLFGGDYAYMGHYERFGGGLLNVLLAPVTQPVLFFSQLADYERLQFLFWTLAPLGFLPLFEWRAAVAALPPYLMLFLTEGDQRVRIAFHYGIEPASALFLALPFGLAAFVRRFGWRSAGLWMLFWGLAAFGPSELSRRSTYAAVPEADWLETEALPCLDPQVSMAASDVLIPHLATRAWISYPGELQQRPSNTPVSCVVTDLRVGNWPLGKTGLEELLSQLPSQGYREVFRCRGFSVYALAGSHCLRCRPACD